MMRRFLVAGGLCVWLAFAAWAQTSDSGDDEIIATAGDISITRGDLLNYVTSLPADVRASDDPLLLLRVIDILVQRALFEAKAEADGLADKPHVRRLLATARQVVLADAYLQEALRDEISEAEIQAEYEKYLQRNPNSEEIRARHILVDNKALAEKLIVELQDGADFAELARLHSRGPSGAQGGDLGDYFQPQAMVAEFSEAAFAMQVGEFSQTPVQTEFGWHIILLEDKRQSAPLSLSDLRSQIEQSLSLIKLEQVIAELMREVSIDYKGVQGANLKSFVAQ